MEPVLRIVAGAVILAAIVSALAMFFEIGRGDSEDK